MPDARPCIASGPATDAVSPLSRRPKPFRSPPVGNEMAGDSLWLVVNHLTDRDSASPIVDDSSVGVWMNILSC